MPSRVDRRALWAALALIVAVRLWTGVCASRALFEPHIGDVGHWMLFGDEIARGRIPFVDFNGLYGPFLLYAFAAGYRALGADWSAALWMLEVASPLLCLGLAWFVTLRALEDDGDRLVFLAAVGLTGLDHFFWTSGLRVWLPLAALVSLQGALTSRRPRSLAAGAFVCGLCPLVSLETAAALGAALVLLLSTRLAGRGLRARAWVPAAVALAAPTLAAAALAPRLCVAYFRTGSEMVALVDWCFGLPFPPHSGALAAFCWFAPFAATAAAFAAALAGLRGRVGPEARARSFDDLSLIAFAAVSLRTVLGRSDYGHLMFSLPAVFLVWQRLCARLTPRAGRWALAAAALGFLPYVALSAHDADGDLRRLGRLAAWETRGAPGNIAWPEEGLSAPRGFVERSRRIVAAVRRRAAVGTDVLSLPLPLYAHLARRGSALAAGSSELVFFGRGGPAAAVAEMEARRAPVLVVDRALGLSMPPLDALNAAASSDPLSGRLTWATPADEPVFREFRASLRSHYALAEIVDGAAIYARRERPAPPVRAEPAEDVPAPRMLELGRLYRIPMPARPGFELRFDLRCAYPLGLDSMAKTFALVGYVERSGVARAALLPVPPAALGLDLRLPLPPTPLSAVVIEVVSPGAFNLAPRSVELRSVRLIPRQRTPR